MPVARHWLLPFWLSAGEAGAAVGAAGAAQTRLASATVAGSAVGAPQKTCLNVVPYPHTKNQLIVARLGTLILQKKNV